MCQVNFLQEVRGKFLEIKSIASGIELALFRNEEEDIDIFEIQLTTPQCRIFKLAQHYCDEKTARQEYQKILGELKGALRRT